MKDYTTAIDGALTQFLTPPTAHGTSEDKPKKPRQKSRINAERKRKAQQAERRAHNARYIADFPGVYKAETDHENPRTRRVQLLFKADLHAELTATAREQGRSLNNLIEGILEQYLERGRR